MVYRGHVHNGRIELDEEVRLPDGAAVSVQLEGPEAEGSFPDHSTHAAYERELAAYSHMLPELLKSSEGRFVAIHQGRVIDQDSDELELARRIQRQHHGEFVLIRQVSSNPPPDDLLESPEWESA